MKSLLLLLIVTVVHAVQKRQVLPGFQFGFKEVCLTDEQVYPAFRNSYNSFTTKLYQILAAREKNSFSTSPSSIWTTLSAIAEGSDYFTQKDLFTFLNLPKELCNRVKFYEIATSRIGLSKYFNNTRALVIDDNARINPPWYGLIQQSALLEVVPAPIRFDAATTSEIINQLIAPKTQKLDLTGNSVLLNSLDFNGLWNTAFSDAVLERAPFYNTAGENVGSVDLLRVVRKARIGHVKSTNLKVLELTVGENNEYSVIFGLPADNDIYPAVRSFNGDALSDALDALKDSSLLIDIAIPRFSIETELNVKEVLKDFGVLSSLWNTQGATRFISTPAARPTTYIERTSITVGPQGVNAPKIEYPVYHHASKEDLYFSEFIADRPFLFGVFDTQTYTCLLTGIFSQPIYPLEVAQPLVEVVQEAVEVPQDNVAVTLVSNAPAAA